MATRKRRGRGDGTLEKRGGVYLARWTVGGRRFSQSLGTADRREAERRLAEIVAPFHLATDAERLEHFTAKLDGTRRLMAEMEAAAPAVKVADAWDIYAESPERPETGGKYAGDCAHRWRLFADYMAKHYPDAPELRQVTRQHAAAFMADYGRTRSATTYNLFIQSARALWRFMADYPGAKIGGADCPFDKIARRRKNAVSRRALTADELVRVCNSITGETRLLFAIGIYTGLRLKDCALLTWGEIDMTRRLVTCTPHKTARLGKVVTIPIHPALFAMLAETPEPKRRGKVLTEVAEAYAARTLAHRIECVFENCGIKTHTEPVNGRRRCLVGFHSLRHTFVSMAANAGAPLAVVQRIVGHASPQMTAHYFHETTRALNAAVALLPNVIDIVPDAATPAEAEPSTAEPVTGCGARSPAFSAFVEVAERLAPDEIGAAVAFLNSRAGND